MVRIPGDEVFILAVIEVVKVLLIAITVSVLTTLDNVWCMYMLRKHGEVIMYHNDIGHIASRAFKTMWNALISFGQNDHTIRRDILSISEVPNELKHPVKRKIHQSSCYRSVRTFLLLFGIILSLAEVIALFTLSTEGKEVADKPEFSVQLRETVEARRGGEIEYFNPHESQLRYEYVLRRLGKRVAFRNGSASEMQIPRRLDVLQDEKWPFQVQLPEDDLYATVYKRDFISEERAPFNEGAGQVTGLTESGKVLRHYIMLPKDKARHACSASMGAVEIKGDYQTGTLCYTDELMDMSCKDRKDKDLVTFKMKCSEIRVQRFGEQRRDDQIWWLSSFADFPTSLGSECIMQMVALRGGKRDDISPSAIIFAALLTEYPTREVLVQRDFAVDVSVVVIPNWLLISTGALVGSLVLLGAAASAYAASRNLVNLTNWQEMFIANLLEPRDCLNRCKRKEFRCVVSEGWGYGQKYQLYVEPEKNITPALWVNRKEIGKPGPGSDEFAANESILSRFNK